ncbi:RIP metalloprotease RseP [Weissella tructae]|nr:MULTISPECIES: RIP metalloprotease RseP [Weissella]
MMGESMQAFIAFIFVFGLIVVVHEFGHFYVAKKAGVRVREFAVGMGPKLFQKQRNGTTYTVRVLPLGGYVRLASQLDDQDSLQAGMTVTLALEDGIVKKINASREADLFVGQPLVVNRFDLVDEMYIEGYRDMESEELTRYTVDHDATIIETDGTAVLVAPRDTLVESAKLWQRALINIAGSFNNLMLTIILFLGLSFALPGVTTSTVDTIAPNTPAATAGLKSGDKLTSVDGKYMTKWGDIQGAIQAAPDKEITLGLVRDDKAETVKITPKGTEIQGMTIGQIGVTPAMDTSVSARVNYAINATVTSVTQIWHAILNMTKDFSLDKLGGPVAIYKTTETVSGFGLLGLLGFVAMLSVNLGMMNLLPIPGLDGGKLLLNLVEAIIRRPVPEKIETVITLIGVAILVLLMLAVTGNDILRYFVR